MGCSSARARQTGGGAGADIADARDESAMTSPALKVEFGVEEEGRRRTRLID